MAGSFEEMVFEIIASDKGASAAFDKFRRSVDSTSSSVDKSSTALDKNAKSLDKNAQSNKSAMGALIGIGAAFAPITAGTAAAGIGFAAFGALAVPSVLKVQKAMTGPGGLAANWSTLDARQRTAAVGVQALGDRYSALAKTMEPRVFQVFNQGLGLASSLLGPVGKLAAASGLGISDFLAQFTASSGIQHFFSFLSSQARPALDSLGSDVTHLSHAVFTLLESFGGVGMLELRALTGVFTALDASISFLSQHAPGLTGVALGIGGIALALAKIGALSSVLKITGLSSIAVQMTGFAAATEGASLAEKGMLASTTALEAVSPVGWALLATAAIGGLVLWMSRFKTVTDQQVTSIEKASNAQGFNTAGYFNAALAIQAANAAQQKQTITVSSGRDVALKQTYALGTLTGATDTLTAASQKLITEGVNQQTFLTGLENKYGLTRAQAIALAGAAGVLAGHVNKGGSSLQGATARAEAFRASLVSAQNPASQMNGDLFVMNQNAVNAASGVTKINTAWATFLGLSTGVETAELGIITNLRQMGKDASVAGASFTGVNKASITLQTDFEGNLAPSIQGIIGNAKTAHASMHDLATVISTDLKPAVDRGALANQGMRQQIFDMAHEAGYDGPNKIKPLTAFIDGNATSLRKADILTNNWARDLAKIPKSPHTNISVSGLGQWSVSQSLAPGTGHRRAAGGLITAGSGPTADDVPILASRHEYVMKAASVARYGVSMMDQINAGRYAAGGVVGSYGPAPVAGLGPWVSRMDAATLKALETSVAAATVAGIRSATAAASGAGFGAAGPGGGSASANAALARRMFPGEDFAAWNYVAMRESGWSQFALNKSSGAYGIAQALPPTKYPFAGQAAGGSNSAAQISWMEGYMRSRYGGAAGAAAHERAFNWYGGGTTGAAPGWAVLGERGPELAYMHGGEPVLSAAQTALAGVRGIRGYASGTEVAAGLGLAGFYAGGGGGVASNLAEMKLFLKDIARYYHGTSALWRDAEVMRQTARLDKVVTRLDAVKATIAAARSYQQSVQSGLSSYADLSGLTVGGIPGQPSGGQYLQTQLQGKLANLKGFATALKALSAAHAPASLIQQVVALGPDAGTQFAQEITAGGPSLMRALAGSEAAISSTELGISRGAASAVYTGKYTPGADFLHGLISQRKGLTDLFRDLGHELGKEAAKWFGVPQRQLPPQLRHHHPVHHPVHHPHHGGAAAGGNTFIVHVHAAPGTNLAEVGRVTVEAIRAFEKGSGPGWRK